ncbi:MAG TPA: MBL fold metallo-hydrolase [Patescibacteria group bacterium]
MKKIQFFGASGGVTGSCYLLTGNNNQTVLVDLGLFQGADDVENINTKPLSFDAKDLSAVFVTHAHLDHCGRLPLLVQNGFSGKIYATKPTKQIIYLSLMDEVAIAEEEKKPALFSKEDVEKTIKLFETISYDQQISVEEFTITFRNAGHILGSASIEITNAGKTICFSGDLGNTPQDLITPTEFISSANFVIMESTYGNSTHPKEDVNDILQKEINSIEHAGGTLLIPAFSIERTQEILHRLNHLKKTNKILDVTPVFLDSPLAIEVTDIFKQNPAFFNEDLQKDTNPFDFPNLIKTKTSEESKQILKVESPKVIIAGSGMLSGGRILHHLINYLPLPTTKILIVGYQAEKTLGREIIDGAKNVKIYHETIPVRATIINIHSLSSHADQPKLLHWLKQIKHVEKIFLTHGENAQREELQQKIKQETQISEVILPTIGEEYEIN